MESILLQVSLQQLGTVFLFLLDKIHYICKYKNKITNKKIK